MLRDVLDKPWPQMSVSQVFVALIESLGSKVRVHIYTYYVYMDIYIYILYIYRVWILCTDIADIIDIIYGSPN